PSGNRLAAVSATGTVTIFDPYWVGPMFTFETQLGGDQNEPLAVAYDSAGERLAVVFDGGQVELWTAAIPRLPPLVNRRTWSASILAQRDKGRELYSRAPAMRLDDTGRLTLVYVRRADEGDPVQHVVALAREAPNGFDEVVLLNDLELTSRHRWSLV